ncbi:hypothetical protein CLAFUW4_12748 [Fulvia fulva]|uniref:2EXR domain-containing protein n=1 Tax=Passalora fulva TaxID=5499 RepID=A0A9Q8PIP9_PASFU|nr:uncharacterized protein CLAFUR5_12614 [Fulvia fulva]KAK4612184.1 hypothetical protein CLAFUR4_12752 [Fulvia fulva]KAK4612373.1 hypothetical protein CLAFUR0_12759 [Fulvia fulva]UJO23286.1 hypothetical protein CLAFUR5_12614 [Fulvia fulva]WPV21579.1 hypothetical protein CLAFUW4_12748 [Fulvia fulva]WPV36617.1 hypothetical protein CLAFUW7_12755 [Fulvia fulva]
MDSTRSCREDTVIKGTSPAAGDSVQQMSPLLELPAELRNTIYAMTMPTDAVINYHTGADATYPRQPRLLQVCRQIRSEAGSLYYRGNTHKFHIPDLDAAQYIHWSQCSPQHKKANIHLHMSFAIPFVLAGKYFPGGLAAKDDPERLWPKLRSWLQHYHACECLGVARPVDGTEYSLKVANTVSEMFEMVHKLGHDHGLYWPQIEAVLENVQGALASANVVWQLR